MSANDYLVERLTRHQIFVQRFGGHEVNKILPFLRGILDDIKAELLRDDLTAYGRNRMLAIEGSISSIVNNGVDGMTAMLADDIAQFGLYESEFMTKLIDGAATVTAASVSPAQIRSAITTKPMNLIKGRTTESLTMQAAFKKFSSTATRDIRRVVQMGIVEGKTTQEMVRDISRLTKSRTRRQIEALVRTVTNHASQVARDITTQENSDIIDKERFVATLDSRTTMTCAGHDGKAFEIGKGPHPALHYNCRSTRVPVLKTEFAALEMEGERPSKGDDGKDLVSGKVTYGGFLKRQSNGFQDEVLGKERAELFRSGKVSIDRFTDNRGIVYNLDELKQREGLTLN